MRPLIAPRAPRNDPAPSRWAYRWQRLWLTPLFRLVVKAGLPVVAVVGGAALWLADDDRRADLLNAYDTLRVEFQNRPEFMVNLIEIEGASPVLAEAIRVALALDLPRSSFAIDLDAARARAETFDAVEKADLRIVGGGVLEVRVTERLPALVWRLPDAVWLIDATGHRVAQIGARSLRGDLPLVAGAGAEQAAAEALALVAAAGPLVPRLRGLVRMGERRWDLVLDRGQRILLPPDDPVRALERLLALDQAEGILDRDITAVDLRLDRRPTLRLAPQAAETLRQVRLAQTGG